MEAELRLRLEHGMGGAVDAALDAVSLPTEELLKPLLQSEPFTTMRSELASEAQAAAAVQLNTDAAANATEAAAAAEARTRLMTAVPEHGAIGQALKTLNAQPAEVATLHRTPGLTEWWAGGEDGVLDLDALDADSHASLPPYEQLGDLAEQLCSTDEHQRRAGHDALEQYRDHGLMGCPDWPAVCHALQKCLGDPVHDLAERALQWHEELFAIATDGGEDAEVTQCADIFHNLTQHLLFWFQRSDEGMPASGVAPQAAVATWHRFALGLVDAGWSLIHEPRIYTFVGATAQLIAEPKAMLAIAAIDPEARWFHRWTMAMHRRARTFECMAASAPDLGERLLTTLERGGVGSIGAAVTPQSSSVSDAKTEPECEDTILVLQHTLGVVSALMIFPAGAATLLASFFLGSTGKYMQATGDVTKLGQDSLAETSAAATAAVRNGTVGVHVMKLVCDIISMTIAQPHVHSDTHTHRLREACAATLKNIAQRHPRTALRLMHVTGAGGDEYEHEEGADADADADAKALSFVVACAIEEPLAELGSLSLLLQQQVPKSEPTSTDTAGAGSAGATEGGRNTLSSVVHALEIAAAIFESSLCADAFAQSDLTQLRRKTREQQGQEQGAHATTEAAASRPASASTSSASSNLSLQHSRVLEAVVQFTRWLVSGCSNDLRKVGMLSASKHIEAAAAAASARAQSQAKLITVESAPQCGKSSVASLLYPAVRLWSKISNTTPSEGILRVSAGQSQLHHDVPSFLLHVLQIALVSQQGCETTTPSTPRDGDAEVATQDDDVPTGGLTVLPRALLKMMAACLAEWSSSSAGWATVASASTAIQSTRGLHREEDEEAGTATETADSDTHSDDRAPKGEPAATLSLLLPRVLVVSRARSCCQEAANGGSASPTFALVEPALAKRAISTLLSTSFGASALMDAGLVISLLLELKAVILEPSPATLLALAEPPPQWLLPWRWRDQLGETGGMYSSGTDAVNFTNNATVGKQMAVVHEVASMLASPLVLHALLQHSPSRSSTSPAVGAANTHASVQAASVMLRQIVLSAVRANQRQQQLATKEEEEQEEEEDGYGENAQYNAVATDKGFWAPEGAATGQWLSLSDDGVQVVLRVLFHIASASPTTAASLDEAFGLSTSLAAAVRASCICPQALVPSTTTSGRVQRHTAMKDHTVTVDSLNLERWRLWSALGAAGNCGGICAPPPPPPSAMDTAADELRRALLEPEPQLEPEAQLQPQLEPEPSGSEDVRSVTTTNNIGVKTDHPELSVLDELAKSFLKPKKAKDTGTVAVVPEDARQGCKLASQLRKWWSISSVEALQYACERPHTARLLLALIMAGHEQQGRMQPDGFASANDTDDETSGDRVRRLSWLNQWLTMTIDTGVKEREEDDKENCQGGDVDSRSLVETFVQALDIRGLVMELQPTVPNSDISDGRRLSVSVLNRIAAAVEMLLEAEVPTLATVLIHGGHGHGYGSVSSLVHHWCNGCFCTGVLPAWDGLSYALLSWLFYGNSQLVILCFALLRSLAPQLMDLHRLTTAHEAEPTCGGAMFGLAAIHASICLSDGPAASVANCANHIDSGYASTQACQKYAKAAAPPPPPTGLTFIASCCELRLEYGDWAERVVRGVA